MDNPFLLGISILLVAICAGFLAEKLGDKAADKIVGKEQRQRMKKQRYRYYLELKNTAHYPYWTMVREADSVKIVAYKSHATEEEAVAWLKERAAFIGDEDPVIKRKLTSRY